MTERSGKGAGIVDISRPFGYLEWLSAKEEILARYPFVEYIEVGRSVLGREIGAFRLGRGKREVHYNGAMHANEWITGLLLMRFVEDCAEAYQQDGTWMGCDVGKLLDESSVWVIPIINPDGVELVLRGEESAPDFADLLRIWNGGQSSFDGWKANVRGVDLNDQFPAYWETERERRDVEGPGPRDYTGEAPLSEPEAAALAAFTRSRSFRLVMAFHSQGREIYWNYRDFEPLESERIADRLAKVSGYQPIRLEGSDAGYKDWFIQEFRRPGFTVEVGYGVNPLPLTDIQEIYPEAAAMMLEGLKYF